MKAEEITAAKPCLPTSARALQPSAYCLLALVAVYLLTAGWNLNLQTVANPDEPRYAAAARDILRDGDWLVPKFNAEPRLIKPIFFYWLIATTDKAGTAVGLSETTSLRLGPALMGLLALVATFLLGRRLFGLRAAFIAGGVLITCAQFHKLSRLLVVDMTLAAFLVCAWLCFHVALEAIEQKEKKFLPLLGFYIALGMASMTKGPVLVGVFVVVPLLVFLWWTGRLRTLLRAGLWWGVPLALVLGFWWFAALWHAGYRDAVKAFFITENFQRAAGAKDHTSHPWPYLFYFQTLAENFLPWVVALPFVAYWSYRGVRAAGLRGLSDPAKFLTCCLAVPFLLMGASVSKRPLYLLPLYPFIALWVAYAWDRALLSRADQSPQPGHVSWAETISFAILGGIAAAAIMPAYEADLETSEGIALVILVTLVAGCGGYAVRALARNLHLRASILVLVTAALLVLGYEAVVLPIRERREDRRYFFDRVNALAAGKGLIVAGLRNEAVWYLDRKEHIDDLQRKYLKAKFFGYQNTLLLISDENLAKVPGLKECLLLGPEIKRGPQTFHLASPDPQNPPAPSWFEAKRGDQAPDTGD